MFDQLPWASLSMSRPQSFQAQTTRIISKKARSFSPLVPIILGYVPILAPVTLALRSTQKNCGDLAVDPLHADLVNPTELGL